MTKPLSNLDAIINKKEKIKKSTDVRTAEIFANIKFDLKEKIEDVKRMMRLKTGKSVTMREVLETMIASYDPEKD